MKKIDKYRKLQEELTAARHEIDRLNREIQKHVETEEALRISQEKYSKVFSFCPDSIALSRVKDGLFVDVNERFTFFSGYTKEEAVGKTVLELELWNEPEDRERFVKELKQKGEVTSMDTKFKNKDGSIRHASISARTITIYNELYMMSFSHDITERKRNEDKLAQSEERFRNLITNFPAGISYCDSSDNILFVNNKFTEIFGYSLEDIPTVGIWIEKAFSEEQCRKAFLPNYHVEPSKYKYSLLQNESVGMSKHLLTCRDGTVKEIELTAIIIRGYTYVIFIDATERKRAEKELQDLQKKVYEAEILKKQAEISALQAQINPHFLYNTLSAIDSMALVKGEKEISEMCTALGKLLRYNIESGEISTIGDEFEKIRTYLYIAKKRFKERLEYSISVDRVLNGYSIIKLIIQPLVENALKHGLEGKTEKVYISVCCIRRSDENDIEIKVDDTGLGVSPDKLDEIRKELEMPYRIYPENYKNTFVSIGLKNVNHRIKLKYGNRYGLRFYSEEGKGTSVIITLPAVMNGDLNWREGFDR